MKKTMKITKEQVYKMDRAARRQAEIEMGITPFKHKAHKMKTDYNRQKNKQIKIDE